MIGGAAQTVSLWLSASIRSSRLLEAELPSERGGIWLLGKAGADSKPSPTSGRTTSSAGGVNRQFTVLCQKLKLFGGQLLAVDGSKFAGQRADQNFNAAKLQDLIERADAGLAEYLRNWTPPMRPERAGGALTKAELAARLRRLQEKQEWHAELLAQLDDEQKQIM